MKYIRCFFMILLAILLLTNGRVEAFAMSTGFSTEMLPEDDIDTFLKNINISMLTEEPSKASIKCFDVNENGEIAIGCDAFESKTICVYRRDGTFQYGYSFECSGSFGIEWDKSNLMIYFVRSDVAIEMNPLGEVEAICKIHNTAENNSYWHQSVFSTRREAGDIEYALKNDMGILNLVASSYSQLIAIDSLGKETILYDVNSAQFAKILTISLFAIGFFLTAVFAITWQFIKLNRKIQM